MHLQWLWFPQYLRILVRHQVRFGQVNVWYIWFVMEWLRFILLKRGKDSIRDLSFFQKSCQIICRSRRPLNLSSGLVAHFWHVVTQYLRHTGSWLGGGHRLKVFGVKLLLKNMFGQKGSLLVAAIVGMMMKLFILRISLAMTHYIVYARLCLSRSGSTRVQLNIHLPLQQIL